MSLFKIAIFYTTNSRYWPHNVFIQSVRDGDPKECYGETYHGKIFTVDYQ